MTFAFLRRRGTRQHEGGYVLMILLLTMALMIIFAAVIVPTIKFQIERDREEEMIHRGVQYARAIRKYYKRFGRYPATIENLESTNNLRFLRKRYKDPITGQDFRLLHMGEVKLLFGGGNVTIQPGAPGVPLNTGSGGTPQNSTTGGTSATGIGQTLGQVGGADSSQSSSSTGTGSNSPGQDSNDGGTSSGNDAGNSGGQSQGKTFGGMPIVGVVSTSKKDSIREFNHKHKYDEWQFIYDPGTDRGGLLMTPNQPPLNLQNGQNPSGTNNGPATTNNIGNPPSVTNTPNPPVTGQPSTGNDPNNPQQ